VSATAFRDLEKYAPELWDVVQSYRQKHFETDFANLIREGRRQGVFRKDVDVKVFLFLYSQAAQHVLNPEAFRMLGVSAHKVFESVCKVLFEGLLTERARCKKCGLRLRHRHAMPGWSRTKKCKAARAV
jgi:hypothetical protein